MPELKKNIALPVAQQEQLDAINRQAQLERLYNKYPSDAIVPTPTPSPGLVQRITNMFSPAIAAPQSIALPTSGISDEEALKLNIEAGQLRYLQQLEETKRNQKPIATTGSRG